jgi:hypothetical protein
MYFVQLRIALAYNHELARAREAASQRWRR